MNVLKRDGGVDLLELNNLIEASDYPIKVIARMSGMSRQTLHNKRSGKSPFTVKEILAISEVLKLSKKKRKQIFLI